MFCKSIGKIWHAFWNPLGCDFTECVLLAGLADCSMSCQHGRLAWLFLRGTELLALSQLTRWVYGVKVEVNSANAVTVAQSRVVTLETCRTRQSWQEKRRTWQQLALQRLWHALSQLRHQAPWCLRSRLWMARLWLRSAPWRSRHSPRLPSAALWRTPRYVPLINIIQRC